MLVDIGDLPRPDSHVLSETLWQGKPVKGKGADGNPTEEGEQSEQSNTNTNTNLNSLHSIESSNKRNLSELQDLQESTTTKRSKLDDPAVKDNNGSEPNDTHTRTENTTTSSAEANHHSNSTDVTGSVEAN